MNSDIHTKILSEDAFVVYDATSGEILHIHKVTAMEGSEAPDENHVEQDVLALVCEANKRSVMKVLRVDPTQLRPGYTYKVELAPHAFVAEPLNPKP